MLFFVKRMCFFPALCLALLLCGCERPTLDTLLHRSVRYMEQDKIDFAQVCLDEARMIAPEDPRVTLAQAYLFLQTDSSLIGMEKAFDCVEKVLKQEPDNFEANYLAGQLVLKMQGRPYPALKYLEKAYLIDSHESRNTLLLVNAYMLCRQYNKAMAALQRLSRVHAADIEPWKVAHQMGICAAHMRQYDAAIRHFSRAMALAEESQTLPSLLNLATCYALKNDTENARTYYQRFVFLAAPNPAYLTHVNAAKAWIERNRGPSGRPNR